MRQFAACFLLFLVVAVAGCRQHDHPGHYDYEAMPESHLPLDVREAFQRDFPGRAIEKSGREKFRTGVTHYHLEFRGASGELRSADYLPDGTKLKAH